MKEKIPIIGTTEFRDPSEYDTPWPELRVDTFSEFILNIHDDGGAPVVKKELTEDLEYLGDVRTWCVFK